MKQVIFFSLLVALIGSASAFYGKNSAITALTPQNFAQTVIASPKVWVVEFYAPWCGHCKSFAPEFEKAAENMKGIVNVGAVDCDNKDNQPLCGHFKVEGFPTVKLFKADPEQKEMEGKIAMMKDPIDYQGPRTAAAVANWALNFIPDRVGVVTDVTLPKFEEIKFNKVLLFSEKEAHSNMIKALALDFDERTALMQEKRTFLPFGQASKEQKKTVEKYKITKFPTLVVLKADNTPIMYSGEMKYDALFAFLKEHANAVTEEHRRAAYEQQPGAKKNAPPSPPTPAAPPKLWQVQDQASFNEACQSSGICLISFLDPSSSDHSSYVSTLEKLVSNPKFASVRIMWVDGTKYPDFQTAFRTADGFPQAVAFQRKSLRIRYFKSGFEEGLLAEFLEMVQGGKGRTASLDAEPKFSTKTDL